MPARADIIWWHMFVAHWNGVSMLWDQRRATPDVRVESDASGTWGCGAIALPSWFALEWTPELQPRSIQIKELIPVVTAAAIYGREWKGKVVLFVVDNLAVVEIIRPTYSKEPHLMHLIRLLTFFAALFDFWFYAEHIPGRENVWADAISRNRANAFLSQVPQARSPSDVPPALVALMSMNVTWTSTPWMELFHRILQQV